MTSRKKYKNTEEDIKKYGGEFLCGYFAECNRFCNSKICNLSQGYNHPECPGDQEMSKRLKARMETDPEFAAKYELVENDQKE